MKPEALFNYEVTGLDVQFTDASSNGPTSWAWDFGDGNTDTVQNPSHTYSRRGFFVVSLVATNADGSSDTFQRSVGVTDVADIPVLPVSTYNIVLSYLPEGTTYGLSEIDTLIRKWRLYLQPLVHDPLVSDANVFSEFYWLPLWNLLIAESVALDIIIQSANQMIVNTNNVGSGTAGGSLKKVVTGPDQAEWNSPTESTDASSSLLKPGGAIDTLKQQICMLASRLRIRLPICKDLRYSPNLPEVTYPVINGQPIIIE